jgi:hypothetical protein
MASPDNRAYQEPKGDITMNTQELTDKQIEASTELTRAQARLLNAQAEELEQKLANNGK